MKFKILLILLFNFVRPIATFPGEEFINFLSAIRFAYGEFRLFLRPFGRFDNVYLKYFSFNPLNLDNTSNLAMKIKIHSAIALVEWKICQNKDKMPKKKYVDMEFEIKSLFTSTFLSIKKHNFTLTGYYRLLLCRLLQIKFDLFKILNETFLGETDKRPNCANETAILGTFEENMGQISELILSDLMHFLPKRPNLTTFFNNVARNGNESQINQIQQKFENLIGVGGFQLIQKTFLEKIQWPIFNPNFSYQNLYNELFVADSKLRKWRTKIVLEKFLYDESAQKMFEAEKAKAIDKANNLSKNLAVFEKLSNLIEKMKEIWQMYSEKFWFNEKIIREKIENLAKRKKSKNLEMIKETLLAHYKEINEIEINEKDILMFWENGPEDTSFFRALYICIGQLFAEKNAEKFLENSEENFEEKWMTTKQLEVLNCVAKRVKKNAWKREEIVEKLHLTKMGEIIWENEFGDEFREKLSKNKGKWCKLLGLNGRKMDELLAESEYFSTNENVAFSSADDSSAESDHETYKDANSETENNFGENAKNYEEILEENLAENFKNKLPKEEKNKTKNYYGRKEKKKANLEKKQWTEEKEEKSGENQMKTPKYYTKLAKNKEHKKRN